jgi:RNA polymerase sigma-70 factor (ECF subfamily)
MMSTGRSDALQALYDRYSARALRLARSVCDDQGRAEDAVQDTFVSVFETALTCSSQSGTVAAWVLTAVLNRAIEISQRDGGRVTRSASGIGLPIDSGAHHATDGAGGSIETSRVRIALSELPSAQRAVIALALYGGLTHTEIAERLGLSSTTVKGQMRLGMDKLSRYLQSGRA